MFLKWLIKNRVAVGIVALAVIFIIFIAAMAASYKNRMAMTRGISSQLTTTNQGTGGSTALSPAVSNLGKLSAKFESGTMSKKELRQSRRVLRGLNNLAI